MEQTLKLTGIYPVGEVVENYNQTRQQKKEAKKLIKENNKFSKIRDSIIEQTLHMTYSEIEQSKAFAENYNNLSSHDRMLALKRNALAAERAKGKNSTNAAITALAWTLTTLTSIVAPGLAWVPLSISAATTAKTLKDAYKARKGLSSDAILKGGDYNNAFEEFYNTEYLPKIQQMNKDRDMLLSKQKTLSKSEFKEYISQYCETLTNNKGQNKGEV